MIKNVIKKQLNEAGKIKIGRKGDEITSSKGNKFRPPERLDHFIITTTEKDENGDYVVDNELMENLKFSKDTRVNADGNITGIPIRLLYDDTDLNFPNRLARYSKGILTCQGDGEISTRRIDGFKNEHPCLCEKFTDPNYNGDKCKVNGALTCVIDEATLFGQVYRFRTTSINSVQGIIGGIELIKTATMGKIAGIPLMLVVDNKSTVVPATGQPTVIQVVSICYRGNMEALRANCLTLLENDKKFLIGMDALEKEAKQLGYNTVVNDSEDVEFQEEFYPESAQHITQEIENVIEANQINNSNEDDEDDNENNSELYVIFNKEVDPEKAKKMIPRLKKGEIILFLKNIGKKFANSDLTNLTKSAFVKIAQDYFDKEIEKNKDAESAKSKEQAKTEDPIQTEFEKAAANIRPLQKQSEIVEAMQVLFQDRIINPTLPPSELGKIFEKWVAEDLKAGRTHGVVDIDAAEDEEKENSFDNIPETVENINHGTEDSVYIFDNSGPVKETQLAEMVKIKKTYSISNENWFEMVSKFLDADKNPVKKAVQLTQKQGDQMIKDALAFVDKKIPF